MAQYITGDGDAGQILSALTEQNAFVTHLQDGVTYRFHHMMKECAERSFQAMPLESMGVPLLLRIRYAVLPQLLPALASAVLYRFDVNIREASVLGLVGAGGIGAPLIFAMNHYKWSEAGAIALGLILLVWCIDRLSASLRR